MSSYYYSTVFYEDDAYYVFTRTIKSKKSIACIPAGLSLMFRGKSYTTADILSLIFQSWKHTGNIDALVNVCKDLTHPRDWKSVSNKKLLFVRIYNALKDTMPKGGAFGL